MLTALNYALCECETACQQACMMYHVCAWCLCACCISTLQRIALILPTLISCGLLTCPSRGRESGLGDAAARPAPDTPVRSLSPSDTRCGSQHVQSAATRANACDMIMRSSPLRHPTRTRANNGQSSNQSTLSETERLQALWCTRPPCWVVGGYRLGPPEPVVAS